MKPAQSHEVGARRAVYSNFGGGRLGVKRVEAIAKVQAKFELARMASRLPSFSEWNLAGAAVDNDFSPQRAHFADDLGGEACER
jgi:hypothetical protein